MSMKLYNTLGREEQEVVASNPDGILRMYNCGPTVYKRQHIGNYRAYINWDILHRALVYLGYKVERVMNITDVGHLTSDDDWGEDKMEKGAKLANMSANEIADFYIRTFLDDLSILNILSPSFEKIDPTMDLKDLATKNLTRATEYIDTIIEINKRIVENGYGYETDQALYFDVSKYPEYTKLSGQKLSEKLVGVRDEVNVDAQKRNSADFVLWMKRKGTYANHLLHWESPWGDGFPGWHIECSAMGYAKLGDTIDIHTGGIEHIGTHHTNEIAQNFGAFEKQVVKIWVHNDHLRAVDGDKLSKSSGNALTLPELLDAGVDPMDFRYFVASINYRMPVRFSMEAVAGARSARLGVIQKLQILNAEGGEGHALDEYKARFQRALVANLNMSEAFAVLLDVVKADSNPADIVATVLDFDRVLGLRFEESISSPVPAEVMELVEKRKISRENKDFALSDSLRDEISSLGYNVLDTPDGQKISKNI